MSPPKRAILRKAALSIGIAIVLLGAGWWFFIRTESPAPPETVEIDVPPPDPRLTYDTPFRNVKPDVAYVGDKACARCHSDIDKSYHQHPMGRSAAFTNRATGIEGYDDASKNPFSALGRLECRVEKRADRVLHHIIGKDKSGKTQVEYALEPTLAIGSGQRGRSYCYVEGESVWESPVSWFSQKKIWDLSPGFFSEENFQRPIVADCLFCHVNRVSPIANSENRYREPIFPMQAAIGCERCHGPGELHVAERNREALLTAIDTSIVNPKHLAPDLRRAVCQQCHLQGESRIARRGRDLFEYRPGLPLDAFVSVFIYHPNFIDYTKSVGQFEQMSMSKCFTSSNGRMDCTSCHNPHGTPDAETKIDFYRAKCVSCHQDRGCSLPVVERKAKADNCVSCHMPGNPSGNVAHTAVTDHRILRNRAKEEEFRARPLNPGETPLVPFFKDSAVGEAEADRDLGLALAKWALNLPPNQKNDRTVGLTLAQTRLTTALKKWPNDVPLLETMAQLLEAQGRGNRALATIQKAVAIAPDREHSLSIAVKIALQAGDGAFAEECATKIVEMNPSSFRHLMTRAFLRLKLQKFGEAEADCRAALRENPTHGKLRVILAVSLQRQGNPTGAQRELTMALDMASAAESSSLRRLFSDLMRSR